MYPTISDLLNDLLGINIPLPIQSFGFFVAVAFLVVSMVLVREIRRYQQENYFPEVKKKVIKGKKLSYNDYVTSSIIGFIIGYKLLFAVLNYSDFVNNPQELVLSLNGSFFGGLLGILLAGYLKYSENKKEQKKYGINKEVIETLAASQISANILVLGAIFGLLGAKLFHNLEYLDELIHDPIGALFSFSGLTFYGGLIVAAIAIIYYGKKIKIKPLRMCDITAPALALGYGIGRIGCHISGDGDWGIVNSLSKPSWLGFLPDWFWAYNYPNNVINEGVLIDGCTGRHCYILPEAVFPTPLWEAILGIVMFLILWNLRKRIKVAGALFSIYMILQGIERFFIEKIRVNSMYDIFGFQITQAEIISFFSVLLGIVGLIYLYKNKKKFISY